MHKPVLLESVLSHLDLKPGQIVLDGTVGSGGHAEAILKVLGPTGLIIGLDQDPHAIERAEKRLKETGGRYMLKRLNFRHLNHALSGLNIFKLDAVFLDIGFSSDQLDDAGRGFSFMREGPLDMRMDQSQDLTAEHLISSASEAELFEIFRSLGEERFSRPIARTIIRNRAHMQIKTTTQLKDVIEKAVPGKFRHGRIHPATRVFQALRIAVNDELEALKEALPKAIDVLRPGGKLAVISFHSLEDRIVKHFFVEMKGAGQGRIITKKPVEATEDEIASNPRARSAKLRVLERT